MGQSMRQSNLFTKTLKQAPGDEVSLNSRLLIRGGFVEKTMAGVYNFLPLGLRVLNKIENIVREEMDAAGGQEVYMSSLSPTRLWEITGRLEEVDVLFKARGANEASREKNDSEYILNSTHEELFTPLLQKYVSGYRELPVLVYQIQTKFRNEPRPRSGLLRGREFRMKDLYSFHRDQEDMYRCYEGMKEAYHRVFKRLEVGEDTYVSLASGGDFTTDYSHEFQTACANGEDTIFRDPDTGECYNEEVTPARVPDPGQQEEVLSLEKVHTPDIRTIEEMNKFSDVPASKMVKTLLYEDENGQVIAALIRGDREVNEEKLYRAVDFRSLKLCDKEKVKEVTGAEHGFSGPLGLPEHVEIYADDSLEGLKNMVVGANETDNHYKNVNWETDLALPEQFCDIKAAKEGDLSPSSGKQYEIFRASEVGNIFPLNTKFTDSFQYYYDDENGERKKVYMASYGMGPTRLMGVLAEKFSDEKGLLWPESVSPFKAHLLKLPSASNSQVADKAEEIYNKLKEGGVEVLYDDREELQAGEKFADADLIGCPYRVVVSEKTLEKEGVEVKKREEKENRIVSEKELFDLLS